MIKNLKNLNAKNMIKAYFDKMELKTSERKIAAIWTPETEE